MMGLLKEGFYKAVKQNKPTQLSFFFAGAGLE